jgi:hypothetical protein
MTGARSPLGVPVEIELAGALERCAHAGRADFGALAEAQLSALAKQLGVPSPSGVSIAPGRSPRVVRFVVQEEIVPWSLATLRRTWLVTAPPELRDLPFIHPRSAGGNLDQWLPALAEAPPVQGVDTAELIATYLSRLLIETLAVHPAALLGPAGAASYLDPAGEWFTPEEARLLLVELLELGVSLRAGDQILSLATACRAAGASLEDTVEEIFSCLCERMITVEVSDEWLAKAGTERTEAMTLRRGEGGTRADLRSTGKAIEQRLRALGVTRGVRFSRAEDLGPGEVRIASAVRPGLPIPVARPGEIAVQDPPWELGVDGATARILIDTASGHQLVALPAEEAGAIRAKGRLPLAAEAFLAVAIVRELTAFADRLIDITDVERDLADTEATHPDLVHSVLRRHSSARLTRLYRGLLAEQVPTRDVWAVLNALLRYEAVPIPEPGLALFDHRVPVADPQLPASRAPIADLVSSVRLQLKGPLVWDGALRGGDPRVLQGYAVDERLEAALHRRIGADGWTAEDDDAVRRSVGRALALAVSTADALLVVPAPVRPALHDSLAGEFRSLRVLARSEIPPEVPVKILEVIALE